MTYTTLGSVVVLLSAFSVTACSDPGIVFKEATTTEHEIFTSDVETSGLNIEATGSIECAICETKRPYTARHCYTCAVCVDKVSGFNGTELFGIVILLFSLIIIVLSRESASGRRT